MLPGLSCRLPGNAGRPAGEQDRRLLGELADSLALVAVYTAGNQDAFLRNDMAVDATRQRLREIALACARLSGNARHATRRALTGLPGILGHGPYQPGRSAAITSPSSGRSSTARSRRQGIVS